MSTSMLNPAEFPDEATANIMSCRQAVTGLAPLRKKRLRQLMQVGIALSAAGLAQSSFAVCTESTGSVIATLGSNCTTTLVTTPQVGPQPSMTYSGTNVAYASGKGTSLTFSKFDTIINTASPNVYALAVGGNNGGVAVANSTVTAQNLSFNLTSTLASTINTRAIYFYLNDSTDTPSIGNLLNVTGDLTGNVQLAAAFLQMARVTNVPSKGAVNVSGATTVTVKSGGKANIARVAGGSLNLSGAVKWDSSAVRVNGVPGESTQILVDATSDQNTTLINFGSTFDGTVAGPGNRVVTSGAGTFTVAGKATLASTASNVVSIAGTGVMKLQGAGSSLATLATDGSPAVLMGGSGQLTATGPITVNAPAGSGVAIGYVGATNANATLTNATVTSAPTVFTADATSTGANFTGHGGTYTGNSTNSGTLNITLDTAARWNMTGNSAATLIQLSGGATLDSSVATAVNVAMAGSIDNAGGIVSLTQSNSTPTNVLNVSKAYTANGGTLQLDTVLNQGGASSQSDLLMAASVVAGSAPTLIFITPAAGSLGAATQGKGILLVQVTGGASASAPGAFALAAPLQNNGATYVLVRDASDGNWYLRTPQTGQITVSKQVTSPADAPAYSGSIPFTLNCTNPVSSVTGSIPVVANQGSAAPITVQEGSECTVAEGTLPTPPTGYLWAVTSYQQPGTPMVANGAQTAVITNSLEKDQRAIEGGQLVVRKSVITPADAAPFSGSIAFTVDCTNPTAHYTGTIAVTANAGAAAPLDVASGSACTVTEQLPAAPQGYRWQAPSYAQAGAIPVNSAVTASITNTLVKSAAVDATPVPTLGEWAMLLLSTLLAGFAAMRLRRNSVR